MSSICEKNFSLTLCVMSPSGLTMAGRNVYATDLLIRLRQDLNNANYAKNVSNFFLGRPIQLN